MPSRIQFSDIIDYGGAAVSALAGGITVEYFFDVALAIFMISAILFIAWCAKGYLTARTRQKARRKLKRPGSVRRLVQPDWRIK
jgi:hypothetical protein